MAGEVLFEARATVSGVAKSFLTVAFVDARGRRRHEMVAKPMRMGVPLPAALGCAGTARYVQRSPSSALWSFEPDAAEEGS